MEHHHTVKVGITEYKQKSWRYDSKQQISILILAAVILCPELSAPANGGVTLNTQTFGVGTTATYSCDPGYVLVGEITRTCEDTHRGATGTWNGTEPLCDGMQTLIKC